MGRVVVPTIKGDLSPVCAWSFTHLRSAAIGPSPTLPRPRPGHPPRRRAPPRRTLRHTSASPLALRGRRVRCRPSTTGPPVIGYLAVGPPLWPSEAGLCATVSLLTASPPPALRAPCCRPYSCRHPAVWLPSPAFLSPALAAAFSAAPLTP